MRLALAVGLGVATAVASAIVLGDYPLGGSVPWIAAFVVPFLIGAVMVIVADSSETLIWFLTGPLAAASIGWGVRIATGWGLDPVPASCWSALTIAFLWPPAWAFVRMSRQAKPAVAGLSQHGHPAGGDGASAGDGQLADVRLIRRPEVGDPQEHVLPGAPAQGESGVTGDV